MNSTISFNVIPQPEVINTASPIIKGMEERFSSYLILSLLICTCMIMFGIIICVLKQKSTPSPSISRSGRLRQMEETRSECLPEYSPAKFDISEPCPALTPCNNNCHVRSDYNRFSTPPEYNSVLNVV